MICMPPNSAPAPSRTGLLAIITAAAPGRKLPIIPNIITPPWAPRAPVRPVLKSGLDALARRRRATCRATARRRRSAGPTGRSAGTEIELLLGEQLDRLGADRPLALLDGDEGAGHLVGDLRLQVPGHLVPLVALLEDLDALVHLARDVAHPAAQGVGDVRGQVGDAVVDEHRPSGAGPTQVLDAGVGLLDGGHRTGDGGRVVEQLALLLQPGADEAHDALDVVGRTGRGALLGRGHDLVAEMARSARGTGSPR